MSKEVNFATLAMVTAWLRARAQDANGEQTVSINVADLLVIADGIIVASGLSPAEYEVNDQVLGQPSLLEQISNARAAA